MLVYNTKRRVPRLLGWEKLDSERALSSSNWISSRVLIMLLKRLLSRQKRFYMTETIHRMLKFNFLYNVMVNYIFCSYEYIYEYIFPLFKFAHKV